ncbi:MAG: Crp/Fnr family transcriptional regulator [Pseudodesulfovibrio sp.]|uniref:Cyclic nucleotide-binding protein n=1 Tax=Pseudodesulfovibrio aespoeensis (strain ATCC 700646 / DSM 10631 / Aspo-2) TaxID=643562 RepID=E6VY92_PSEA9|nr:MULTISPECIES: Crp/Fnr family transcriptional regulator [Pseudodesulfovibrio]MBU4192663.1 Crp/Fnr family transcriptional regulator [Pseudomonadota bacterium]ADU61550.1 cyclic nucleotide-binding protein [Pseudodesulfovibrio aespoeensis Aspo-2]MBU4243101.1 Crp/Fnr family transcriptional regulator [Pseudomonadota bacterium]MBU4377486.1 Crp/Fnr family transcriptional regulator [Pseudomonadota bacterium]MBU4474629.1 Crp/Fnr family transcriptional regulator [Pseudomonadota bacterium]
MKFTGVNLLDELGRDELGELRNVFRERAWSKGAIIFDADETDNLVFIIAEGRVRVYLAYEDKEFTLGILGPGDLYATHAGCYVQAFDDTRLLLADVQSVKRCMTEMPVFTRTMVRVLGNILQNTFSIIGGLAFKDIYDRLMDYILIEAQDNGVPEGDGLTISLGLTTEQLAQLLGATRQTVSTLLNDMVRAGFMEKRGRGRFHIPSLDALKRAAAG